jgi:hypothetical protein
MDDRQRRPFAAQSLQELLNHRPSPLDLYFYRSTGIAHKSCQREPGCQAIRKWAKTDALDDTIDTYSQPHQL